MEEFKKGDLVEPNGKWEHWWNDFKPWPKRFIRLTDHGLVNDLGYGTCLEELDGTPFHGELFSSGFKLSKEYKVLQILRNYVAFKKKASDNKGRNQAEKTTGKSKVSKSNKTTQRR